MTSIGWFETYMLTTTNGFAPLRTGVGRLTPRMALLWSKSLTWWVHTAYMHYFYREGLGAILVIIIYPDHIQQRYVLIKDFVNMVYTIYS